MFLLLLAIIYLTFISLGLPDGLLGASWPSAYPELGVKMSYAGIISMIITVGTIISSLMSNRLTHKFKTSTICCISVFLTAVALFGFSISNSFGLLCLFAIPYGLGAGAIDAALNNYVALNYKSKHMSWLHCFWGIGATVGPYIMGYAISYQNNWHIGYRIVSYIQLAITFIIFLSLPLWKKEALNQQEEKIVSIKEVFKIKGVKEVLIAFFCYCGFELTAGLWGSTFLVEVKGLKENQGATYASLVYLGITLGRLITGFITTKLGDKKMIRIGVIIMVIGLIPILINFDNIIFTLIGLFLFGIGAGPIYPSIIHATPYNFGAQNSSAIIGVQMASAYVGSTLLPPLFGFIAQIFSVSLYPIYLLFFVLLMFILLEISNLKVLNGIKNEKL